MTLHFLEVFAAIALSMVFGCFLGALAHRHVAPTGLGRPQARLAERVDRAAGAARDKAGDVARKLRAGKLSARRPEEAKSGMDEVEKDPRGDGP